MPICSSFTTDRYIDPSVSCVLGCHLITEEVLDIGETILLELPRMQKTQAQVRWVKDQHAGVRFLQGTSALDDRRARIGA